jgi:hypothetical protein
MLVIGLLILDQLWTLGGDMPWAAALALLASLPLLAALDWRMVRGIKRRRLIRAGYLLLWTYLVLGLTPWPRAPLPEPQLMVNKSQRELRFRGKVLRIALSNHSIGTKEESGDGRTPEGRYRICSKAPDGPFGYWLGLDYPSRQDAWNGRRAGRLSWIELTRWNWFWRAEPPQSTRLGGQVGLHGGGTRHNWTLGCIALEEQDIKLLYDSLELGAVVEIR